MAKSLSADTIATILGQRQETVVKLMRYLATQQGYKSASDIVTDWESQALWQIQHDSPRPKSSSSIESLRDYTRPMREALVDLFMLTPVGSFRPSPARLTLGIVCGLRNLMWCASMLRVTNFEEFHRFVEEIDPDDSLFLMFTLLGDEFTRQ